jgi:hypothetical protein
LLRGSGFMFRSMKDVLLRISVLDGRFECPFPSLCIHVFTRFKLYNFQPILQTIYDQKPSHSHT